MKATPIKGADRRAYCSSCESWETANAVASYLVREDYHQHDSEYNEERHYYSAAESTVLHYCDNCGTVLANENDGDEQDINWVSQELWWRCNECNLVYSEKENADACCA